MRVFYGLYFAVSGQKLQFCLYTGICGSEKTHILAYFAQCSIQFKYSIKTQPKIFVMSPNLLMNAKKFKKKQKKKQKLVLVYEYHKLLHWTAYKILRFASPGRQSQ